MELKDVTVIGDYVMNFHWVSSICNHLWLCGSNLIFIRNAKCNHYKGASRRVPLTWKLLEFGPNCAQFVVESTAITMAASGWKDLWLNEAITLSELREWENSRQSLKWWNIWLMSTLLSSLWNNYLLWSTGRLPLVTTKLSLAKRTPQTRSALTVSLARP